ncbi:MAG: methyltransferase family protein [Nitrospinales bacterium]
MKFTRPLVKAFLIAPLNIMIIIPAILHWVSSSWNFLTAFNIDSVPLSKVTGLIIILIGLFIIFRSVSDLTNKGEDGTPASWCPPKNLIVTGLYQRTRNPLYIGVTFVLFGEVLISGTILVIGWFLFWSGGILVVTPLREEPELEERFGDLYKNYIKEVPRWIPRIRER